MTDKATTTTITGVHFQFAYHFCKQNVQKQMNKTDRIHTELNVYRNEPI